MIFYVYLSVLTLIFAVTTAFVWRKTKSAAFMIGAFFLYFWSLFGAWHIVAAIRTGEDTPYLFYKMFPVFLDVDYRNTLFLYGTFITTVMATVLVVARPAAETIQPSQAIRISHFKVIAIAAACGVLGYLIIRPYVNGAGSAYITAREAPGYSIFQILNHGATCISAIGLATFMSGRDGRYIVGKSNALALFGYLGVFGALMLLMLRMGNRGETALTFALLLLFYMANTAKPNRVLLYGTGAVGAVVVTVVKLFRDHLLDAGSGRDALGLLIRSKNEVLQSTESVAAHLSMYGVLHEHIPFTWGSSFLSLAASVVPSAIWADRPPTIYAYYTSGVAAMEGQGYTIHHATGWYLNFGLPGMMAGAVLMGLLWAKFFNMMYDGKTRASQFGNAFAVTAFWTFTSGLPDMLRAGPEVYKTTIFSQLLMPALLVTVCSAQVVLHHHRPTVRFQRRALRIKPRLIEVRREMNSGVEAR